MTVLPGQVQLDIRRFLFERGFERLEQAYRSSVKSPANFQMEAEGIIRRQNGIPVGTPIPPVVVDDDGIPSNDYHDDISMLVDEFDSTHMILVESFTIALFHFWEKQANNWLGVKYYSHSATMSWLKANNSTPHEADLNKLKLIVNAKKHGEGESANALFNLDPTLFWGHGAVGFVPSDRNFALTMPMLDGFFASVKNSV